MRPEVIVLLVGMGTVRTPVRDRSGLSLRPLPPRTEAPDVGFEEAHAVLACLAGLAGRRPKAAAAALAELVNRRGA
jgi:hypothetical protein